MKMTVNGGAARAALICLYVWFHSNGTFGYGSEINDVDCLTLFKESLFDPHGSLNSWTFSNKSQGGICNYTGIECWHPDENKVLTIELPNMGLEGEFPRGLEKCPSLVNLNLSRNKLHGKIPSNIGDILSYVTTIDLSFNQFSGEIPAGLGNCTYLNVLKLDNNQLNGQVPALIGQLPRLITFSVANNSGLCGGPLPRCHGNMNVGVIVGAAVGGVAVSALLLLVCSAVYVARRGDRKG